jgi:hypothetical protein
MPKRLWPPLLLEIAMMRNQPIAGLGRKLLESIRNLVFAARPRLFWSGAGSLRQTMSPVRRIAAFAAAQAQYAAVHIPTFPVSADKRPLVKHFQKFGLHGSAELIDKFADAPAIGFMCGRRITSLDVDTTDEKVLADAIERHGKTPLIVRTGSGKFQAFYKSNGERRRIRPWGPGLPIDLLGKGGFTIAPPSRVKRGTYSFIAGSLADIDRLPVMRGLSADMYVERDDLCVPSDDFLPTADAPATTGSRNNALLKACGRAAHSCATFDMLIGIARQFNLEHCTPPLADEEVTRVAASIWRYEQAGTNRFGLTGSWLPTALARELSTDPYLAALIMRLQAENRPDATFMVTNTFANVLGWPLRKLQDARRAAIDQGYIVQLSKPHQGHAALYGFGPALADARQMPKTNPNSMKAPAKEERTGSRAQAHTRVIEDSYAVLRTLTSGAA